MGASPGEIESAATDLVNRVGRIPAPSFNNYTSVIAAYQHILVDTIALVRDLARNQKSDAEKGDPQT